MSNHSGLHFKYGYDFDTKKYNACIASFDNNMVSSYNSLSEMEITTSKPINSDCFDLLNINYNGGLSFDLSIGCLKDEGFTPWEVGRIQHDLTKNKKYDKLIFYDDSDRNQFYYNCIFVGFEDTKYHNGRAYEIVCKVQCDSPYAYSLYDREYNFRANGTYIINCDSNLDRPLKPNIEFTMAQDGDVTISNLTSGKSFEITGLKQNEKIIITSKNRVISTVALEDDGVTPIYRVNNTNYQFFNIVEGINKVSLNGNFSNMTISFRDCYKMGV